MCPRVSSISAAALVSPTIGRGEPRPIARTPDQIGDLLSGKSLHDETRLIRAAQTALAKLGYAVKIDGVEDGDTRRALRDFERAYGLAITPELARRWLASSRGRLAWDGSERAFDQRRLTSQRRNLTVCRFRLRGRRLSGNVVALLTLRAALLPRAAQGAFRE